MEKSLLSGLFFAIIGAIGALVHGVLTAATLPVQLNHFWGLWFSLWLLFAGEQILIIRQACRNNLQKHVKVNMLYFLLVAIASFISFLCFCTCTGFSEKIGLVWSLFVTIANLWAIYILNSEFPKIHPETGTNRKCCKPCSTVCCLITLNDVIKVFHLLLSIALCAGAIVCAYSESFKPRGTIVQAVQSNENTISMHYICIGPKNVTSTVWIVADVTHGVAEFYGIII